MRSSCQTRALTLDASWQGTQPKRRPCRMAGGKRPVSRPALGKRLKAEFGYDDRKGVGACDRGPSELGTRERVSGTACFSRCGKGGLGRVARHVLSHATSCQTRALILDASGQGSRQIGHPCPVAGGTHPDAELERCPRMDKCPCSQGWRKGTVV